jgi:hypothetical protein
MLPVWRHACGKFPVYSSMGASRSRVPPVPEPFGVDVDRRRDHPIDLA